MTKLTIVESARLELGSEIFGILEDSRSVFSELKSTAELFVWRTFAGE